MIIVQNALEVERPELVEAAISFFEHHIEGHVQLFLNALGIESIHLAFLGAAAEHSSNSAYHRLLLRLL